MKRFSPAILLAIAAALVIVLDPAEVPPQKEPPYWQQIWPLFLFLALALAGVVTLFVITAPPSSRRGRKNVINS